MSDNSTSLIRNPGKADSPTVRGSEGAGTTVLSRTDSFWQIFNLSAARTVLLPSVGVKAGDQIRLDLRSLFTLTVQAANASQIAAMSSLGSGTWVALIDSPAASTDWLFAGGTSPAAMDDASATRLGLKTYLHNVAYNLGNIPLLSGASVSGGVMFGLFNPYQTQDGLWHLKFSIQAIGSSAAAQSFTFATVVSKASYGHQAFTSSEQTTGTAGLRGSHTGVGTSVFAQQFGAAITQWSCSGDVTLESKPNWAY